MSNIYVSQPKYDFPIPKSKNPSIAQRVGREKVQQIRDFLETFSKKNQKNETTDDIYLKYKA